MTVDIGAASGMIRKRPTVADLRARKGRAVGGNCGTMV